MDTNLFLDGFAIFVRCLVSDEDDLASRHAMFFNVYCTEYTRDTRKGKVNLQMCERVKKNLRLTKKILHRRFVERARILNESSRVRDVFEERGLLEAYLRSLRTWHS